MALAAVSQDVSRYLAAHKHRITVAIAAASTWLLARSNRLIFNDSSLIFTFVVIQLCLTFVSLVWTRVVYPNFFSPLRHLPTAPGASFFQGHFARIRREPIGMPMRDWINTVPNHGFIHYRSIFNHERVLATTPETLREVMSNLSYEYVKPTWVKLMLRRVLDRGLLDVDGEEHRLMRKHLMPAFSHRHVKNLFPVFFNTAKHMVRLLDQSTSAEDLSSWASRATLDIIGQAAIGRTFDSLDNPDNELVQIYKRLLNPTKSQLWMDFLAPLIPYSLLQRIPMGRNLDIDTNTTALHRYCRAIVEEKAQSRKEGKANGIDILSVAMDSGYFSPAGLASQMMSFIPAGHETVSNSVAFTILTLLQHPEALHRLRDELRTFPDPRDPHSTISPATLDTFPYLHAVCSESLRLTPPIPATTRVATADHVIAGTRIPAGTYVMLAPQAVNHSVALWGPDASDFKPERWLGAGRGSGGARSSYAFESFLHGPRNCIAQHFARAELAVLVGVLVGAFEMRLLEPGKAWPVSSTVALKLKDPLMVVLTPAVRD